MIQATCSMGASLLIAFIFGWKLAFVVVSFLPLLVISGMIQGRIVRGANKGGKKAIEEGGKVSKTSTVVSRVKGGGLQKAKHPLHICIGNQPLRRQHIRLPFSLD